MMRNGIVAALHHKIITRINWGPCDVSFIDLEVSSLESYLI